MRQEVSFWNGFYSCSVCKVVMLQTSDANDFVNDKSHSTKKPLLAEYSRKAQLVNILISWCLLLACSLKNKTLFSLFHYDTLSCMFSRGIINVAIFWRHSILLSSEFEYLGVLTSKTGPFYIWERKWARPLSSGRRVRISQPVSVTSSVCSNWAERFPSYRK